MYKVSGFTPGTFVLAALSKTGWQYFFVNCVLKQNAESYNKYFRIITNQYHGKNTRYNRPWRNT